MKNDREDVKSCSAVFIGLSHSW